MLSKELRQSLSDRMLEIVPPMSNVIGISGNMIREWATEVRKLEAAVEAAKEFADDPSGEQYDRLLEALDDKKPS